MIVEKQTLLISGAIPLHTRDAAASIIFSDGEYLGTISPARDVPLSKTTNRISFQQFLFQDGFVVRMLNQNVVPAALVTELPLKLARKCVEAFGVAAFEEEASPQGISTGLDEEIASICVGKEFGLSRTTSGKVYTSVYTTYGLLIWM